MKIDKYINNYFEKSIQALSKISKEDLKNSINILIKLKKRKGRLFLLGVGGSAANCSHAVNDFRKICNIESYSPVDNVSELSARVNDDGWDTVFVAWLKGSRLSRKDAVMVFSVGGGNKQKNISTNIIAALVYAKKKKASILGVISRNGGYTRRVADVSILVPVVDNTLITPLAESFQALLWHCMVNYPELRK